MAPKKSPAKMPRIMARRVNSGMIFSEGMYGRNSPGGATELQGFEAGAVSRDCASFVLVAGALSIRRYSPKSSAGTHGSIIHGGRQVARRCGGSGGGR